MSDLKFMSGLAKFKQFTLNKTEVFLPICNKTCYVDALIVGDHLSLTSTLMSPVGYDKEMTNLLHKHVEFAGEDQNYTMPKVRFSQELSNIDRLYLIWGLYKATYEVLEKRTVTCTNPQCREKMEGIDIPLDDLINEETYKVWDKDVPFNEYREYLIYPYNNIVWEFQVKLPTIADNNAMLSMLPIDVLQKNLDTIQSVFSRSQQMALFVDALRISSKDDSIQSIESTKRQEILTAIDSYMPHVISEKFFKDHSELFDKYVPKFSKKFTCSSCSMEIDYSVDIELEFFRRSLLGGGEG